MAWAFALLTVAGFAVLLGSCSCRSDSDNASNTSMETGGSSAALNSVELATQEKAAMAGDDAALDQVVSHYLFGTGGPRGDIKSALRWLQIGAERGVDEHTTSYLSLTSAEDADCARVVALFETVADQEARTDIVDANAYVASCVNNRRQ